MADRAQGSETSGIEALGQFDTGRPPEQNPRRAMWGLFAAAGLLAVVAVVMIGVLLIRNAGESGLDASEAAYGTAVEELTSAAEGLGASIDTAQGVLDASAGQVTDETLRTTLIEEIGTARSVLDAAQKVKPESGFTTVSNVDQATVEVVELTTAVADRSEALTGANEAVAESQTQFLVQQASTARDEASTALAAAVQNGETVYAQSAGRVLDESARDQLRAALDAATTANSGTDVGSDLATVQQVTKNLEGSRAAVETAAQAVIEAQSAWQAEQERQAQETPPQEESPEPRGDDGDDDRGQGRPSDDQLRWLQQQPPAGADQDGSDAWWQYYDTQGNLWCMDSSRAVWRC